MGLSDTAFWLALLEIIGINIILSGDNALVIALACRSLPVQQRRLGVAFGAGAAVLLRVIFTLVIAWQLSIPWLKVAGGALLLWIGWKLMQPQDEDDGVAAGSHLWDAVRIVVIADAVMSLDNVIAVAAAAKGNTVLLVAGLIISVPLVVYGATLLMKLIERFPPIVVLGAALIGYIAGEVAVTDPVIEPALHAGADWLHWAAPVVTTILVVVIGRITGGLPAIASAGAALGATLVGAAGAFLIRVAGRILAMIAILLAARWGLDQAGELRMLDVAMTVIEPLVPVLVAALVTAAVEYGAPRQAGDGHGPTAT